MHALTRPPRCSLEVHYGWPVGCGETLQCLTYPRIGGNTVAAPLELRCEGASVDHWACPLDNRGRTNHRHRRLSCGSCDPFYRSRRPAGLEGSGIRPGHVLPPRSRRRSGCRAAAGAHHMVGLATVAGGCRRSHGGLCAIPRTGVAQLLDDVGNWAEPLGIISLVVEGLLLIVAATCLLTSRR